MAHYSVMWLSIVLSLNNRLVNHMSKCKILRLRLGTSDSDLRIKRMYSLNTVCLLRNYYTFKHLKLKNSVFYKINSLLTYITCTKMYQNDRHRIYKVL